MAILVYSAEFIALILRLLLLFYSSTLESNANLDRFLRILFVISITIVLGLLVPQVLRYYFFFARLKLQQLKSEHKFTCKRANFLILPILGSLFYLALSCVLLSEIVLQFVNENVKFKLEMAEYRKSSLILVFSFNGSGIMFLIYCVAKNQQKKKSLKSNKPMSINKNNETLRDFEGEGGGEAALQIKRG